MAPGLFHLNSGVLLEQGLDLALTDHPLDPSLSALDAVLHLAIRQSREKAHYFLIGIRNRAVVAFSWMWNYVTYQRGARLIVDGADEQQAARDEKATPAATAVEVTRPAERVPSSGSDWR